MSFTVTSPYSGKVPGRTPRSCSSQPVSVRSQIAASRMFETGFQALPQTVLPSADTPSAAQNHSLS